MRDVPGFGRRKDGPAGRRKAVRERMDLTVSLYAIDQSRVALIEDVSSTGCRIRGSGLPGVGQDVLLKASEVELFGRIVWKDDLNRGVQFDEPISEKTLLELRHVLAREKGLDGVPPQIIPTEGRRNT